MKKFYLFIVFSILALGTISWFSFKPPLKFDILLDHLKADEDFQLNLFYSDIRMRNIQGFKASRSHITPLHSSLQSYTEGFLPSHDVQRILTLVNGFRKTQGKPPLSYFHDYYEDDALIIVSFTGGLENIYVISKTTWEVSPLRYNEQDNLGEMYVSHIKRIEDVFVLAGGRVSDYSAYIYTIDAFSYTVLTGTNIPTHPSAISDQHYTIDAAGNVLFIGGTSLDILPYASKTPINMPLLLEAQYIFSNVEDSVCLSLGADSLHYVLINSKLEIKKSGTLPLPNTDVLLIDAFIKNKHLYLITFDPSHKLYRNSIALYDLDTNKLIYCLGLYAYKDLALLKATF